MWHVFDVFHAVWTVHLWICSQSHLGRLPLWIIMWRVCDMNTDPNTSEFDLWNYAWLWLFKTLHPAVWGGKKKITNILVRVPLFYSTSPPCHPHRPPTAFLSSSSSTWPSPDENNTCTTQWLTGSCVCQHALHSSCVQGVCRTTVCARRVWWRTKVGSLTGWLLESFGRVDDDVKEAVQAWSLFIWA